MKLQLALDMIDMDHALEIAEMTAPFADIIEVGTPLLKYGGIRVIEGIRSRFPDAQILADTKTMDTGAYEADFCFNAGADLITVLGVADLSTIYSAVQCAHKHGKQVVVDMLNVQHMNKVALACEKIGVDYIGVHTGIDQQRRGGSPLKNLQELSRTFSLKIAVAGGINLSTINSIVAENPAIVVVGGAITSAEDPAFMAKTLRERMVPHVREHLCEAAENPFVAA